MEAVQLFRFRIVKSQLCIGFRGRISDLHKYPSRATGNFEVGLKDRWAWARICINGKKSNRFYAILGPIYEDKKEFCNTPSQIHFWRRQCKHREHRRNAKNKLRHTSQFIKQKEKRILLRLSQQIDYDSTLFSIENTKKLNWLKCNYFSSSFKFSL